MSQLARGLLYLLGELTEDYLVAQLVEGNGCNQMVIVHDLSVVKATALCKRIDRNQGLIEVQVPSKRLCDTAKQFPGAASERVPKLVVRSPGEIVKAENDISQCARRYRRPRPVRRPTLCSSGYRDGPIP